MAAEAARERLRELERAEQALEGREEAGKALADERIARVRLSVAGDVGGRAGAVRTTTPASRQRKVARKVQGRGASRRTSFFDG